MGAAAKAVIGAPALHSVEGRGVFLVERAAGPHVAPGRLALLAIPRHPPPDHIKDRGAVQDFIQEGAIELGHRPYDRHGQRLWEQARPDSDMELCTARGLGRIGPGFRPTDHAVIETTLWCGELEGWSLEEFRLGACWCMIKTQTKRRAFGHILPDGAHKRSIRRRHR
jgi:hypothetical protein